MEGGVKISGSFLVPIIVPVVAFITLTALLGIVYWADAHPEWNAPKRKCDSRGGGLMARICTRVQPREKRVACNRALCCICCWSRKLSFATWFDLDKNERRTHYYVLFWLIALALILVFVPTSGWPRWVLVGFAFYRLQDVIFSTLDNVFKLTTRSIPSDEWVLTPVVLALINIVQVVLIFAIAYLILTGHNPRSFSNPPTGRFGEFFLSWISLPPLGGGASPQSSPAKVLAIAEEGTGLLIIVIAIGRFLTVADSKRSGSTPPSDT